MDEQFDNQLNNRIREVFENFEDTTADESWILLRKKFLKKEKDRGIIWLWLGAAAAILLLALGIGTWVNLKKDQPVKLSYKPGKPYHPQNKPANKNENNSAQKQEALTGVYPGKTGIAANTTPQNKLKSAVNNTIAIQAVNKNTAAQPASNNTDAEKNATTLEPGNKTAIVDNKSAPSPALVNDTSNNNTINNAVATTTVPDKPATSPGLPFLPDKPVAANGQKAFKPVNKDNSTPKIHFSLYEATYFNYAKGSDNRVNIGAGVTSDIKLTNNLMLSTGVAIAQNTLNYAYQVPAQTNQQGYAVANTTPFNSTSKSPANTASYAIPVLKSSDAQLVGLDIPVNLKYEFNPQKNNSFISVGLSSGTFINESYNYQYNYSNNAAFSSTTQQTQTQSTASSFSNFYFAKTLNVSFGLGYSLGKNHLIVEPFLKYPLQGLGSQQIRFGAAGLNLKFDFMAPPKMQLIRWY